jgi:hypothetical protein
MSAGGGEVIRLNIEAGYCPGWRAADGCRELVQNWRDSPRVAQSSSRAPVHLLRETLTEYTGWCANEFTAGG